MQLTVSKIPDNKYKFRWFSGCSYILTRLDSIRNNTMIKYIIVIHSVHQWLSYYQQLIYSIDYSNIELNPT